MKKPTINKGLNNRINTRGILEQRGFPVKFKHSHAKSIPFLCNYFYRITGTPVMIYLKNPYSRFNYRLKGKSHIKVF